MLKKAAALFFVCASIAICVSCSTTANRYLYAAIPGGAAGEIVAYREDPNSGALTQLAGSPITTVRVDADRLYTLTTARRYRTGVLHLRFTAGLQAYSFTFG